MILSKNTLKLHSLFFRAGVANVLTILFLVLGNIPYWQNGISFSLVFLFKIFMNLYFISCPFVYIKTINSFDADTSTNLKTKYAFGGGVVVFSNLVVATMLILLHQSGFTFLSPFS